MASGCFLIGLLLSPLAAVPEPPSDAQLLDQAEAEFRAGRDSRTDLRQARGHFARAAEGYEALRQRGYRNAALFRNQGNAYLLAGDLPRAILAYRRGVRLAPGDRQLRASLTTARAEVAYPSPGIFARPPEEFWPPWVPRLQPARAYQLAIVASGLFWLALARWGMVRRHWLLGAALAALTMTVVLTNYFIFEARNACLQEMKRPLVVVARDGVVLRKGNGLSYPPRETTPLNRGVEAQLLFPRGNWLQIRLAGGEVGWVPRTDVLVDDAGLLMAPPKFHLPPNLVALGQLDLNDYGELGEWPRCEGPLPRRCPKPAHSWAWTGHVAFGRNSSAHRPMWRAGGTDGSSGRMTVWREKQRSPVFYDGREMGRQAMNGASERLVGLSVEELEALADSLLAPTAQARLDDLLARQKEKPLSADEERVLDNLLQKIDQLTILKTRARYTLNQERTAMTRT